MQGGNTPLGEERIKFMNYLDKYYRAFRDYRATTEPDRELARRRDSAKKPSKDDILQVAGYNCTVDEDWIVAIEKGLEYIGKAVEEERQFIRSNGEVVPIEKVKNVSRESVEHLSKHSNLITRLPEGADIIPDGLYTVERLTDYAVYENRFLYMLLLFVRDFASFRFEKIIEFSCLYEGEYRAERKVEAGKRNARIKIEFEEKIKCDEFLSENNPLKDVISRIDGILKTVNAYLSTPLMEFVAKAPLLKPPVTETNVLKMNKNFKGAMQLYYFLTSYTGQGFTAERSVRTVNTLSDGAADEFAEVGELVSFLTYGHGTGVTARLNERYEEEEERRKKEEERKKAEKLEDLRRRAKRNGGDAEEYALMLEKKVRALEKENAQLDAARAEIAALTQKCESVEDKNRNLEEKSAALNARIDELKSAHAVEIEELKSDFKKERAEFETRLSESAAQLEKLKFDCEKSENAKVISDAKLNALKKEHGLFGGDEEFTSKESFDELERQYAAFKALFRDEWKKAKKKIKKEIYEGKDE